MCAGSVTLPDVEPAPPDDDADELENDVEDELEEGALDPDEVELEPPAWDEGADDEV